MTPCGTWHFQALLLLVRCWLTRVRLSVCQKALLRLCSADCPCFVLQASCACMQAEPCNEGGRGAQDGDAEDQEFAIVFAAMGVNMETAYFFKQVLPLTLTFLGSVCCPPFRALVGSEMLTNTCVPPSEWQIANFFKWPP